MIASFQSILSFSFQENRECFSTLLKNTLEIFRCSEKILNSQDNYHLPLYCLNTINVDMSGYANLSKSDLRIIAKTIDTLKFLFHLPELVLSQESFILLEYEKEFEGARQQDVILFNITFNAVQLKSAS